MKKQKPTSWRSKSAQQQKDKMEIYNSREWAELRRAKMQANPICELCWKQEGVATAAACIHHVHPIEQSASKQEMRMFAFNWENLQSLCLRHHAEVHKQAGANKKENVAERRALRQERWKDGLIAKFATASTTVPAQGDGTQGG